MRNEATAFAYQPNSKVEIPAPKQATEKKSAVILQFSNKKTDELAKTKTFDTGRFSGENNTISIKTIEEQNNTFKKDNISIELHEAKRVLNDVEMGTFNFINDELLGIYFWEFDHSLEYEFYVDFIDEKLREVFKYDFNRTVDTKRKESIENETKGEIKFSDLLTYGELWKKYNIDQSGIIDKYIEFVDNHLNGVKKYIAIGNSEKQAEFVEKFKKWQIRKSEITKWRNDLSNKKNELLKIENTELAIKISAKYQEIAMLADNLIKRVQLSFQSKEDLSPNDIHELRYSLLHRAESIYASAMENIKSGALLNYENISLNVENIRQDTIFFTNLFKTFAKNNPDISFENFKGITFETSSGVEISKNKEDSARMIEVAEKNYLENESLKKLVVESLEEGLQKENSQFYILRHNGEIVAFCRFDNEGDHFYAGSFNVDPDYRGSAIGEVMLREAEDKKAKEKPVHAITDPEKRICVKYVEGQGFTIGGVLYTELDGKTLKEVEIIRDDENNGRYAYRQNGINRERLLEMYREQKSKTEILRAKDSFIVQFSKNEMSRFLSVTDKLCKEYGYVITRYFPVDKNEGRMFATFEQKL